MLVQASAKTKFRDIAAAATLWLPFLAVAGTWLLWIDALPAELPRQWGSDGTVSTTIPTWAMGTIAAGITLGAALLATYWLRERGAPSRRLVYLGAGCAAGLSGPAWLVTAGVTIAAGPGGEPVLGAWILAILAACGYGALPYFLASTWVDVPIVREPVTVNLADTEVIAWTKTVTSWAFGLIGLLVLVASAVVVIPMIQAGITPMDGAIIIVLVVVTLIMLAFVQVRVSVDWRGLRVVSGLLGIRFKRVAIDDIESVHTDELNPMQWGGWGYRFTPGRSAVVLQGGPGLVVNLINGKQFAVTLPDPETPAALLSSLSGRSLSVDTDPQ